MSPVVHISWKINGQKLRSICVIMCRYALYNFAIHIVLKRHHYCIPTSRWIFTLQVLLLTLRLEARRNTFLPSPRSMCRKNVGNRPANIFSGL